MDDEHLKDLEGDIEDARKELENYEKELRIIKKWLDEALVSYAKLILKRDEHIKKINLL